MKYILALILLIFASIIDLQKRIIPDSISWIFIFIGIIYFNINNILSLIILPLPLLLVCLINYNAIGGGDIKLIACLGFVIGLEIGMMVLFFSAFIALILNYKKRIKEIAFAPYILSGYIVAMILKGVELLV